MKNKEIINILSSSSDDEYNNTLTYLEKNQHRVNGEMISIICSRLKSNNSWIKERSANALAKVGDASCVDLLIELLNDRSHFVRSSACEALGSIEDEKAIQHLIRKVDDKDYLVRTNALEALQFSPCSLNMKKVNERLNDKAPLVRLYAIFLLEGKVEIKREIRKEAIKMLKERLELERVGFVKSDILECLYIYEKDEKYFERLVKLTKSRRCIARRRAYSSLGKVANNKNRGLILKILKNALEEEDVNVMKDHIKEVIINYC